MFREKCVLLPRVRSHMPACSQMHARSRLGYQCYWQLITPDLAAVVLSPGVRCLSRSKRHHLHQRRVGYGACGASCNELQKTPALTPTTSRLWSLWCRLQQLQAIPGMESSEAATRRRRSGGHRPIPPDVRCNRQVQTCSSAPMAEADCQISCKMLGLLSSAAA